VGQSAQVAKKSMGQFLVERFTVLGFEFQNWMPILAALAAAYLFYLWKTGKK
jgi:hypothetical protein